MRFLKKYIDILIIIALLIFTLLPLFRSGFYVIQDDEQIGRLFELNKDVLAGQLPPRLAQDLGFGFDYPLFNYYPSFVYYIAEIFHLFGFTFINSTKLMIGLGFILAGYFMYLFSKQYLGRIGGIVAAIAYSYAPYHSVDVYVRGDLPEFWAFAFVPAYFWSLYKLAKTGKNMYIAISAIFIALLVLTHDLVIMMGSFFFGAYYIYLIASEQKKLRFFWKICASIILGLMLSAYFWLPAYTEKQFTLVNILTKELADYHLHYVCIKEFFTSPWGYGGSEPNCYSGLSYQVGQAQLILAAVSIILSIFLLRKKLRHIQVYGIAILFILMFPFSLFMQTKYSFFIWNMIPQFAYIQFPWRFLLFSDFIISFLAAYVFSQIKLSKIKLILAVCMLLLLIFMNKNYFVPEKYLLGATDMSYTAPSVLRWHTSLLSYEYSPLGIATTKSSSGTTIINITQNELPKSNFNILDGDMSVQQLQDIPQQKEFQVNVIQPGKLQLTTFAFPGWKTYINNQQVDYSDSNKFKLITIPLPAGIFTVRATFSNTPIRTASDGLTILSFLCILFFGVYKKLPPEYTKKIKGIFHS